MISKCLLDIGDASKASLKAQHPTVFLRNILDRCSLRRGDAPCQQLSFEHLAKQPQHSSLLVSDRMYQLDPLGVGLNETEYATALPLLLFSPAV